MELDFHKSLLRNIFSLKEEYQILHKFIFIKIAS